MKYDLASDLHIEHMGIPDWASMKSPDSDVLVIAGDISNDPGFSLHVIEEAAKVYPEIIWSDGNHDHYMWNGSVESLMDYFSAEARKMNNVTYLRGDNCQKFGDVAFIGACGWYDFHAFPHRFTTTECMNVWRDIIKDAKYIDFGSFETPDSLARHQADQLRKWVEDFQNDPMISSIVVVTHSAPTVRLLRETGDTHWDMLTGSYCNSAMESVILADTNKKIKVWNYGHTHERRERMIGDVLYVNNACGYGNECGSNWFVAQVDTDSTDPWR